MTGATIAYRDSYKYQLVEDYSIELPILPAQDISGRFVKLTRKGLLTVRTDYAWDGPSGPTEDSPHGMRASLVHDALYQLMREGQLESAKYRSIADRIFYHLLLEDKMPPARAAVWYRGVAVFGEPSASPTNEKPTMRAPFIA